MDWYNEEVSGCLNKAYKLNTGLTHCGPTSRPSPSSCSSPVEPGTNPQQHGRPGLPPAQTHSAGFTPTQESVKVFSRTENGHCEVSDKVQIKLHTELEKQNSALKTVFLWERKLNIKTIFAWNHYNHCFRATDEHRLLPLSRAQNLVGVNYWKKLENSRLMQNKDRLCDITQHTSALRHCKSTDRGD